MHNPLKQLGVLGFGLLLAACVPEFENALETGPAADPALIGVWDGKSDADTQVMRLEVSAQDGGLRLSMRDPTGGSDEEIVLAGRSAEVAGVRYISLTPDDPELLGAGEEKVGFNIFRYEPDGGTIKAWSLHNPKIAQAIEEGRLKGTVKGSGTSQEIKISASSEELAAFFATEEGRDSFNEQGPGAVLILTRVSP